MNYCPNCGNKIEPGHNFCSNCGQKPTQEKSQKAPTKKPKNRNWGITAVLVVVLIIAIASVASGVVIWRCNSTPTPTPYPTNPPPSQPTNLPPTPTHTYQPPTYTPSHQVSLYGPNQVLTSGTYGHQTETIQAGSTLTISWSADASVEIWVITDTQYSDWTTLGWTANYVGYKSGNYGTLTCSIANTDIYYLIISRPGAGLYSPATVYSATASW